MLISSIHLWYSSFKQRTRQPKNRLFFLKCGKLVCFFVKTNLHSLLVLVCFEDKIKTSYICVLESPSLFFVEIDRKGEVWAMYYTCITLHTLSWLMLAAISKILSFALTQQVFLSFYNVVDIIEKICNINFLLYCSKKFIGGGVVSLLNFRICVLKYKIKLIHLAFQTLSIFIMWNEQRLSPIRFIANRPVQSRKAIFHRVFRVSFIHINIYHKF